MKPNLLRSISKSLGEQFSLLPRIRKSFVGLLLFCILFLAGYIGNEGITVSVKPVENGPYFNRLISTYNAGRVQLNGELALTHPTIFQKILLPNAATNIDFLTLLLMAICSVIIILIVPKLQQQNLFRKDISNSIRLLGYLIMLHGILSIYRTIVYAPEKIKFLTHNEFTSLTTFPLFTIAEIYFSLVVIAISSMYQRGVKLQEEQDLTV